MDFKIVYWLDAVSYQSDTPTPEKLKPAEKITIGHLYHNTDKIVTTATEWDVKDEQPSDWTVIPKPLITNMKTLVVK